MRTFIAPNRRISRFKIHNGDDDIVDENWLCVGEDVSGAKLSDYMVIDQDIVTCGILSMEEMMRKLKIMAKIQRGDKVHAYKPEPMSSLSDAITAFETVLTFI
ncbi:hypothetical protein NPIL_262231 [Nephila pilipes]|uniref:Uncharacterized protein n=1 Tax=Nephila pilipes TaxID=299642 RepID=A0A8X6QKR3_NEPPI|nr:hypothetical protein NPIL_262231 [Nephila pilipes]